MIIRVKLGQYGQDEFIICPRVPATIAELRDRMLLRAKVTEGSYAYRLIDNLHTAIFVQSLDLKADYESYFICEYASFYEYLRRRARFPSAVIASLIEAVNVSSGIYHFNPAYAFLDDTYGLDFLTRLIDDMPTGEAS
jgi:hypothetical protein